MVGPEMAAADVARALSIENLEAGIVDPQDMGAERALDQRLVERLEGVGHHAHPLAQSGGGKAHAISLIDMDQPMQGQRVQILAHCEVGQESGTRAPPLR